MHAGVVIAGGVPNPVSGGGALTAYTVVRRLLDDGRRVTVFVLHDPVYYDPAGADMTSRTAHLLELGAEVVPIASGAASAVNGADRGLRSRVRRAVSPQLADLGPHVVDASHVAAAVDDAGCDAVFVYHFEALAASRGIRAPRVAGVGDPSHLPVYYRWRESLPSREALRQSLRVQAVMRGQPKVMVELLEECSAYGAFAAHHAAWLRARGARRCEYYRTPVPDLGGPDAGRRRIAGEPLRILLLGHLRGIVTLNGLSVFGEALPVLDRELGPDGFVVDVVGGYEPPQGFESVLHHPAVRRHGHAEDADAWLKSTDVLVVPTSIPLGVRVRIITAFSAGTPVVTHTANALGIPELEDRVNALVRRSPAEIAAGIVEIARDPALSERLRRGARATYERCFQPSVAAQAIVDRLDEAARQPSAHLV